MATTRRADMFIELKDDPREDGPRMGDERTTLVEVLRAARLTLEMKCAGLDAEAMARRSVEPSTATWVTRTCCASASTDASASNREIKTATLPETGSARLRERCRQGCREGR